MLKDKPRNLAELIKMSRDVLAEQAIALAKFPQKDPFDHGMVTGKWQGASELLDDIEALVQAARKDDDE